MFKDVYLLMTVRSIKTFFKFWRVYDVLLHLEIFMALLCRSIRVISFSDGRLGKLCQDYPEDHCQMLRNRKDNLNNMEVVFLAFSATQAISRLMYWLQLHEKIGPVVINMSRVIVDIFSLMGSYLLICLAFASGLVFVMTTEHYRYILGSNYFET